MTVAYFLLPSVELQDYGYQVPGMLAVVAVLVGTIMHRPANPWPWLLLAAGLALTSMGDWTWVVLAAMGLEPFPSVADLFYLGGIGLLIAAVMWLVRGRVPGGDHAGVLDALIVAVGVGLVSWIYFMSPIVADGDQTFVEIAAALAYPMLDLLLLGVMIRLLLAPGDHVAALRLMIGALVALLLADFPYAFLALVDGYSTGHIVDAGWLLSAVFWGAAALHPSMRQVAEPIRSPEIRFTAWRLMLLAAASLLAPSVLVLQWSAGELVDIPVIAAGSITLFLLVIVRLGGVVNDLRKTLAERRALEQELERRALHDPLTGLANRVLFQDRLEHALAQRAAQVAVLFLDLDDFKTVNDRFGHHAGDSLLGSVAGAIRRAVRPGDTVARLGGDEFAVLLDRSPDVYEAGLVADRLLAAVQEPASVAGSQHAANASIGISIGSGIESSAEQLMREADIAMYVAKGQGKGRYTVFESTTHEAVVRGLELRADLERGIRDRQFTLHFQPIVELSSGEVAGLEALVRWQHPTRGVLPPAEFIALAEATGAIVPLGRWILEEACKQAAALHAHRPDRFIAVNLSAVQLAHPGFAAHLAEVLDATALAPDQLILEITESTRLDTETATAALRAVKELGVRLAIDDFGTGFASLSHLARSPFDLVKVDMSFVHLLASDPRADALVRGVVTLAGSMGMRVVAEGIENATQLAQLRAFGCDLGQGFHFARPMPPAELAEMLGIEPGREGLKPIVRPAFGSG